MPFLKQHLIREGGDQPVASTEKSSFSVKSEVLSSDEEYADTVDKKPSDIGQANISLADNGELYIKVKEEDSLLPKVDDQPVASTEKSSFSIKSEVLCSYEEYADTIDKNPSDIGQSNMSLADAYKKSRFPLVTYEDHNDKADVVEFNLKVEDEDSLLLEGGDHPVASTEKSSFSSFKCTICSKTFQLQRYLNAHLETHTSEQTHPTEDFKCTICSKTFKLHRYLNAHLETHTSEQTHQTEDLKCTICSKTFQRQRYLKTHLKIHTSEQTHPTEDFKCTICSKTFKLQRYLNAHLETHTSEQMHQTEDFKCTICSKTFQRQRYLKTHLKIHSSKQKHPTEDFKCTICSKTFQFQRYLNVHLKTHSTEPTMKCDHCQRCFKTIYSLKKHLKKKNVHEETTFLCSICDKQFRSHRYLTNHLKKHGILKPHLIQEGGDQPVASTEKSSFSVESEVLSSDEEYADTIDMNPSDMGQANMTLADAYKKSRFPLVTYEDHDDKADNEELYMDVEEEDSLLLDDPDNSASVSSFQILPLESSRDIKVEKEDSLLPDDPDNSASVSSFQILPLESSCDIKVEEEDSLLTDDPDNSASVSSFQILPLESSCVVNKSVYPVSRIRKAEEKKLTFDMSKRKRKQTPQIYETYNALSESTHLLSSTGLNIESVG
ncbi:zinc finger protein 26 [Biomphalaria glabrata]|nr:zinc finger protein 26-like [Biomphalaria glabrata]